MQVANHAIILANIANRSQVMKRQFRNSHLKKVSYKYFFRAIYIYLDEKGGKRNYTCVYYSSKFTSLQWRNPMRQHTMHGRKCYSLYCNKDINYRSRIHLMRSKIFTSVNPSATRTTRNGIRPQYAANGLITVRIEVRNTPKP